MNSLYVTTSWDDGHVLDMKLAGLLTKYGIQGTFYIAPKNQEQEKKNLVTDSQIKKLSQDFEIGAHTMTHPSLSMLSDHDAYAEIYGSKKYLESLLKKPVHMFCYPRGLYTPETVSLVKKAGFLGARTITRFCITKPADPYLMDTTLHAFAHRLNMHPAIPPGVQIKALPTLFTKNWLTVAFAYIDYLAVTGGVFHLWGHSWEIEKSGDWEKLEEFFSYLQTFKNVQYKTNAEIIEHNA